MGGVELVKARSSDGQGNEYVSGSGCRGRGWDNLQHFQSTCWAQVGPKSREVCSGGKRLEVVIRAPREVRNPPVTSAYSGTGLWFFSCRVRVKSEELTVMDSL